MKHQLVKAMGIITIILLSCTLICGMWIGSHPTSDIGFHVMLSSVAVVVAMITQVIELSKCRFCHKTKR